MVAIFLLMLAMRNGSYFTVQVSKDGGWSKVRTGDEKWPHSGCILNVEPIKLAVDFVGGMEER